MEWKGDAVIIPGDVGSSSFRQELANLIRHGKIKIISTNLHSTVQLEKDEKKPKKARVKGEKILQTSVKKSESTQVIKEKQEEKEDEEKAIRELNCWKDFDDLANKIGTIHCDNKKELLECFDELKNLYEKYCDISEYMMKISSFSFCCGLFAYYLSEETEGIGEIETHGWNPWSYGRRWRPYSSMHR